MSRPVTLFTGQWADLPLEKLAPLAYVGCVMLEVLVAPIPGIMLYAPGGVVFGGLMGGFLSLIGNTLGAGIACAAAVGLGAYASHGASAQPQAWLRRD